MLTVKALLRFSILYSVLLVHFTECRTLRRWNKNRLYWKLSDPFKLLNPRQYESVRKTVLEAFEEWKYALEGLVEFEENPSDQNADINILFAKKNHSCYEEFDGRGGIVAHSMYPPFGVLHLDGDEEWKTRKDKSDHIIDLRQVILHEIGHTLGLRHSNRKLSVMWKHYEFEKENGILRLSKYDVRAIRKLYGGV